MLDLSYLGLVVIVEWPKGPIFVNMLCMHSMHLPMHLQALLKLMHASAIMFKLMHARALIPKPLYICVLMLELVYSQVLINKLMYA